MSNIIYNVSQVLKDKLLLADNKLVNFTELDKLIKQGMGLEFIDHATKEDLTDEVKNKIRMQSFVEKAKKNEFLFKELPKLGLRGFLDNLELQIIAKALFDKNDDLSKAAKSIGSTAKDIQARLEALDMPVPKKKKGK